MVKATDSKLVGIACACSNRASEDSPFVGDTMNNHIVVSATLASFYVKKTMRKSGQLCRLVKTTYLKYVWFTCLGLKLAADESPFVRVTINNHILLGAATPCLPGYENKIMKKQLTWSSG